MNSPPVIEHKRLFALVALMVTIALLATVAMGWVLYQDAIGRQSIWLELLAKDEAHLISVLASDQHRLLQDRGAVMSEAVEAHGRSSGFGSSAEVVLGHLDGGEIRFLFDLRHDNKGDIRRLALDSGIAEPMRRALAGESGVLVGPDYRNVTVLAAYEPVPNMAMGLVAKIDLDEIRVALLQKVLIGGFGALLIIALGAYFALRLSTPIIKQLKTTVDNLNQAQHLGGLGSWYWNIPSGELIWSDELFRIFGYQPGEMDPTYDAAILAIHADDRAHVEGTLERALDSRECGIPHPAPGWFDSPYRCPGYRP